MKQALCLALLCTTIYGELLQLINVALKPQSLIATALSDGAASQSSEESNSEESDYSKKSNPLPHDFEQNSQTCRPKSASCVKTRYRTIDGTCNNLVNTNIGASQTPYSRLLPYNYGDRVSTLPLSKSGRPLISSRTLSLVFFPEKDLIDSVWTLLTQQWGQIITHDMSRIMEFSDPQDSKTCCNSNGKLSPEAKKNPHCAAIQIPPNDPIHAAQGTQCMNFIRTVSSRDIGCTSPKVPANPLTSVTAFMDLSLVYGSKDSEATPIRAFKGGRLITLVRNGQEWPPQVSNVTITCAATRPDEPCYLSGDSRINQNPQLTVLQILLLREHNRIADTLACLNPHWNDETLYQEARRINIAVNQHINYYEYLPILLGTKHMTKYKLIYPGVAGYVKDYDPKVDPRVLAEHATAAFRYFHTLIRGHLELITEKRKLVGLIRLSDWFNRPLLLEIDDTFNKLARGLTIQPQDRSDQFWTSEITQFLFRGNNTFGGDLRARDIQRGRDHGLAPYVKARAACGLPVPKTFKDMRDFISKKNVDKLELVYESPEDVELVVAASLENNAAGALVGPTFLCILTEQFYRTRVGDRFFYENGANPEIAFTLSQLETIRRGASMARLICDNADGIHQMQPRAFQQLGQGNKLVACQNLPAVDLKLWQDTKGHKN